MEQTMKTIWLWPLAAMSVPAWADESAFAACQRINDRAERYACYDALPLPAGVSRVAPAQPAQPARTGADGFGLEQQRLAAAVAQGPESLESTIPGRFEGWGPNTRFTLANGQVWQVVDGSSAYFPKESPRVTIKRGMLGTFFLSVDGLNRSPKVKRMQ
jgi:hypothetical protein